MTLLPLLLSLCVLVTVAALSVAFYSFQIDRQRREALSRADSRLAGAARPAASLLIDERRRLVDRVGAQLAAWMPSKWFAGEASVALVQAGFESSTASALYTSVRLACALLLPSLALILLPTWDVQLLLLNLIASSALGALAPQVALNRLVRSRQGRIRRALPDALDLLVSCVEAGVNLDAAILRVARDIGPGSPELASELVIVNRRVNAGVTREQALQGLFTRTGVEELRQLASSITQCSKWGTSISKMLRINAESIRRARREAAETTAAEAGLKMLFPLMVFLLPALFVVILGPAAMRMSGALGL